MFYVVVLVLLALSLLPAFSVYKGLVTGKKARFAFIFHLASFGAICLFATIVPFSNFVFAAGTTAAAINPNAGLAYLGAALSTGLAALGAGVAVSSGSSAAIGAISENPKMLSKSLLFVALGEGIALYGLVMSFIILSKV